MRVKRLMLEKRDITRHNESLGRRTIALVSLMDRRISNKHTFKSFRSKFGLRSLIIMHKNSASKDLWGKGIKDYSTMRVEFKEDT